MSELTQRVRSFRDLVRFNESVLLLSLMLSALLLTLLVLVLFHLPGWLACIGLVPVGILLVRARRMQSLLSAAETIEQSYPILKKRLVPALQFSSAGLPARHGYSSELAQAAVLDAWQAIRPLRLTRLVRWSRMLYGIAALAVALALWGVAGTVARDRLSEGWYLSFAPARYPLELEVMPGHTRAEKGQTLAISLRARSPFPVKQALLLRRDNSDQVTRTTVMLKDGEGTIDVPVDAEFDYWFACVNRRTPVFHVGLKQPLQITNLTFRHRYPAYSKLPDQTSQSREIVALVGTRVEVRGEVDHELARGELRFGDSTAVQLRLQGKVFSGEFSVHQPAEFALTLLDVTGTEANPERFRVSPVADEYPFVRLFAPGANMDLPSTMKVILGANSVDDYGLSSLTLNYSRDSVATSIPLKQLGNRLEDTTFYVWDLSKLDLLPGSSVQYYVTVLDNDAVSGPKSSRSETFTLKFPTLTELFSEATQKTAQVESAMQPLSDQQKQLQEQSGKLDDALKRNRELSWEEKQSLGKVLDNQDSLLAAVRQLHDDVRKAMDNMFQGAVMDSAALAGLEQLDTLLSQVLPKQMIQALDSLRGAMSKSPQDLKAALQKFKFSQEDMQKAIERAVDLLKRLRQEQEMDALVRKADELLREQEKLQKNTRRENSDQMAERQAELGQSIDSLKQQVNDLARELKEPESAQQLADAAQQMEQDSLSQQAQDAAASYRQGKSANARQKGEKVRSGLESLRDRLQQAKEGMSRKRSQDISDKLLRAADDLLTVSDAQEDIELRIDLTHDLSDLVGEEKRLGDAARIVAETLAALSMRNMMVPPQLTEPIVRALKNTDDAAQALESNMSSRARQQAQGMRAGLNQAVEDILQTLKQAEQGSGFGGGMESLMEMLSRAISQQMGLGEQMGGMFPVPMPGQGMSAEQMQQWQELMARQQALREMLEQMLQKAGGEQPGMSGSVEAALEEMRQLEQEMANLNPQRPYVERSERIVNKLLDAQRSIRQREKNDQRESEAGRQFTAPASPRLPADLGERKKVLREELMRALKEQFPREYESYVKAYFESLLR